MSAPQEAIDAENARFWDELCGSSLARNVGVNDASAESLRRFDAAYLAHYPYLGATCAAQGSPAAPCSRSGSVTGR